MTKWAEPMKGESAGFETARQVWNGMIDRRPSAIMACADVADVRRALEIAGDQPVSVKGGGHNIGGTAVADGALMIDLALMNRIEVDPDRAIAHVGGGATWAMLDAVTQAHGLAAPGGVVSSTGIGGLTLGGGFGWLSRKHGLAVDNLIAADIVLANGETVTARADENPDLFWAIRGGGGNFGIVTRFTFRLHNVGPGVLFGPTFFALDKAGEVLRAYARHAPDLPREACVWANLTTAPPVPVLSSRDHGEKVLILMQFWGGAPEDGVEALERLYGGVKPLGSALMPRPFTEAQAFLDPAYAHGARNYWRTHNLPGLSDGLIDALVALAPDLPSPASELLIVQLGGAVGDVSGDATAFPHRGVPFMCTPGVRWEDAEHDGQMTGWLRDASAHIAPHAIPGGYVNFIAEGGDNTGAAYGHNRERLARLKARYDPTNRFRFNQNILPQGA